ncbi:M23 family metallopeptidase [Brevundimonas sp. R86498]|uniref:M23 family metallopeptidase n=1 Tax=Brevundimonas sp. R86498 TaxID=3093845 RepID=UPI0037C88B03
MLALCLLITACEANPQAPDVVPAVPAQRIAGRPVLQLPVDCRPGVDCEIQNHVDRDPGPGVRDYRCGSLTYDGHTGVDIRIPDLPAMRAGVAVLAGADGVVARLRDGMEDAAVRGRPTDAVEGVECGNGLVLDHGGGWTTQYCHLGRGSVRVAVGQTVQAGDPVGRIGLSGNTEYPHLHFTVRHDTNVIDPFAPDPGTGPACGTGVGLWSEAAARVLTYRPGAVLNAGFAGAPVEMASVESGALTPPGPTAPLVAWVRAIGLKVGDVQTLSVTGPDGSSLVDSTADPLPRDQAQRLLFAGRRAPPGGWPAGRYIADYTVRRGDVVILERQFEHRMAAVF